MRMDKVAAEPNEANEARGILVFFRSCPLNFQIAKELFNEANVPHTKFTTHSVLQTKSRSGVCNAQINILRVSCRQNTLSLSMILGLLAYVIFA